MAEFRVARSGTSSAAAGEIDRLAALDDAAWQAVYDEFFLKLRNFAYARTGDLAESEDIASETLAGAVRGIGAYRERGVPFGAWLFRIARNVTTDHLRRRGRRPEPAVLSDEHVAPGSEHTALEDRDELLRVIDRLTEEQQTVIGLRFFADCSLEDAAKTMGRSVHAVKGLQQRALASLRRHLTAEEGA